MDYSFFKSSPEDIFSLLLESEEGRERNSDVRNINCLPPIQAWTEDHLHSDGGPTHNLGMCPDWESNLQTFGYGMMF